MSSLNILHTEVYMTRTNPWLITCVSVIATCFLLALTRVTSYLVDLHNQESGPHGCRRLGLHAKSNLEDEHHERYSRPEQKGGIAAWKVKSLWIYPVKSCKGVELNEGTVTGRGMEYDRQFCFAQLVSKFPASQDESREEKAQHAWKFITQRTFPAMANVKTELWIPDQSSLTYAKEHPHIKSEGVLVLRFPSLVKEIGFWRGVWDILKPFGRKRETTVHIPFNPTDEQVSKSGYPVENMEIWKDNPTSLLMASTESSEPWIQDLRYYLGITNHLALFRARSDKPREVYRCAPRRGEIGYQSTVAFQDAYPLHILNLASVHDVARNMEKGAPSIGAQNFRPNIVITGGDAYAEDSWKRISIGDFEYYAACRTVRCLLPNVNPATGVRHRSEPNRTLKAIRRIDEGDPKNACLGMQMVPAIEASRIAVGDAITVLETGEHFYIKQSNWAEHGTEEAFSDKARRFARALTTKDGLVGDYDYAFLFKPNLPFMKKTKRAAPFFGLNDKMPIFLALLLGFQHALSMLAGIITPPIIIAGQGGAALGADDTQYLVSTALIVAGILSSIQITRFHIYKSPYYVGTGLISVVGTSFSIIPVTAGAFSQMYATGYCPTGADGTKLPCPKGYGALLGTACLCSLLEIGLSFTKPAVLKKVFPPLVTGPTVTLIGISLIQSGFQDWAGGSGTPGCITRPTSGPYSVCPEVGAPHALPWGSAEYIGLGFSVFVTIILCERFGSPIMKSCAVVVGLLVGCIIAGATGYFPSSGIDAAPAVSFIWVKTFPLTVYAPIILPLMAVYIVLMMEAIGDITATCDVSRLEVEGKLFDSRIQGGVLADGFNGLIAGLCTITPMSTFAQNNGVIALTRCANRKAGYGACFFLVIMGIFSKFAAALVAIPAPVLGGLTTFLFSSVAVSGIRIISTVPFTRRNRFILTAAMSLGFGAILVPNWFSFVFTYKGGNQSKQGFFNAIVLVLETGFAVTAFLAIFLNLILAEEIEDETVSITANDADAADDREEWERIQRGKLSGKDEETGGNSVDGKGMVGEK